MSSRSFFLNFGQRPFPKIAGKSPACSCSNKELYQSPLILTELFPNKSFLSHGMLPLSGYDDVALFE